MADRSVVRVFALLASTAVFALLPAVIILGKRGRQMRLGGPSLGEAISHARLSRALMIAQIALAMVLVSTASVLMGTFVRLQALPSGVQPKQLTVFQVQLKGDRYATTQHTAQFVSTVLDRLRTTPGVDRAAAINGLLLDRGLNIGGNQNRHAACARSSSSALSRRVISSIAGIPLLPAGRTCCGKRSCRAGIAVAVIGAAAAKKVVAGALTRSARPLHIQGTENWRIVESGGRCPVCTRCRKSQGVVIYAPIAQLGDKETEMINGWFPTTFAMKTAAHISLAEAAQQAVERADPEVPVARLATMQAVIDSTIEEPRFFSLLASGFSGFALVLTVIGLFGLLSYQVTQRTREIGVRMALGANRINILRTFLGRGLAVALAGVAFGLIASWLLRPVVGHLLSDAGVDTVSSTTQNIVMNGVQAALLAAFAIVAVTLVASWFPARRAASIEPMQALRTE